MTATTSALSLESVWVNTLFTGFFLGLGVCIGLATLDSIMGIPFNPDPLIGSCLAAFTLGLAIVRAAVSWRLIRGERA